MTVDCPICKKKVQLGAPDFPFCSERCQLIDLGKWANEDYKISEPARPEDLAQSDEDE
jgi:endogenous inhibitor of DNA gyrase (YacG/DUF329 family)